MSYSSVLWDLDDDFNGNVQHIAEHGITQEEVEEVLQFPFCFDQSSSTGLPIAFGESRGRFIVVVFEEIDDDTVYPITAYEVER